MPFPVTVDGKPLRDEKARTTLTPEELALEQAARDRVHEWFTKGQHLTKHQVKNTTLLLDASLVGHTEAARVLLEKVVRVLIEREFGVGLVVGVGRVVKYTALHHAAAGGHTDVVCHSHSRVHETNDILTLVVLQPLVLRPFSPLYPLNL